MTILGLMIILKFLSFSFKNFWFWSASSTAAAVTAGSLLVSMRLVRRPQFYCGTNVVHLFKIKSVCNNSSFTSGHKGAQAVLTEPGSVCWRPQKKKYKWSNRCMKLTVQICIGINNALLWYTFMQHRFN